MPLAAPSSRPASSLVNISAGGPSPFSWPPGVAVLSSRSTLCSTDFLLFSTQHFMGYSIFSPFHISHSSFFKLIFSLEDNYNIVGFAIHQYELAAGAHVFLHPETPSHLLSHPIPPSCPRAPALSALLHASELHWSSISHMVIYMLQCFSLKSSHPHLLPPSKSLFFISVSLLLP